MGCCASTSYKAVSAPQQKCRWSAARSDVSCNSQAAPPPEEETVKEVLSETPTLKPAISKADNEEKKGGSKPVLHNIQEEGDNKVDNNSPLMTTEASEVSDIYSLSESFSTMTEKREDEDGEVRQRVDGSPAKFRNLALSGDIWEGTTTLSNSPARKSEPSPVRVRSLPGREKCAVATDGQRLDNKGDISGRRSRSPATRTAELGAAREGLGRHTGKSPGRVRSNVPDSTRKLEETKEETPVTPPTTNETLENPLVSLECFIFL